MADLTLNETTPPRPIAPRLIGFAAVATIPLIAWSRDVAVATLVLSMFTLFLIGGRPRFTALRLTPAVLFTGLLFAWSFAATFWAPHFPIETWAKTAAGVGLGAGLALMLSRQPRETVAGFASPLLWSVFALVALLLIERVTDGFFIGLFRETETAFQRITALSGGLVLLCCTCFTCGALLSRFLSAFVAIPLWTCVVLGVSLSYPMDAEGLAIVGGAVVFAAIMVWGRAAAIALMTLLAAGLVGLGFLATAAADAGLHHWLIANVDPNWGYRVEIWRYVNELIQNRIVEGYGFDSSRVLGESAALMPSFEGKRSFLHPHNGMLQLWLELGLVGVVLFLAAAIFGFRAFLARNPDRMAIATVCATLTTSAALWSLSFGAWQGWWLAVLGLTASSVVIALTPVQQGAKRILFLVTEYYFFDALKKELTQGALRQGYEIYVAGRCRDGDLERTSDGIKVIPFDWKRSPSLIVSIAYFLPDLARVCRLLNGIGPAIIHNIALKPSIIGSLAAVGRPIRVINAIHGFGFLFMSRALSARLIQAVCGIVLKASARCNDALFLLINRHDLALVRDRMGVPADQLKLIHGTGIDLDRFTPLPDPPLPFRFLVIGRLLYMKGAHIVVDAHRLLRERGIGSELVMCGSPDPDNPSSVPRAVIDEWAGIPGITFAGQVADVRPLIGASHALILPSLGGEGLPRALSEAAASQRALIATDIPGNTEIVIPGQTGLLVPAGDAAALSEAMQQMIERTSERLAFARAGRAMMEREFSSAHVAQAHAAIYQDAVQAGRLAGSTPVRKL